ncbi:unnamed protein product [Cyprideis torosa]|uniref:Uncharacterized protein n=1 Tax=Cyprideis torosa TaxID=163714 RepID=A0A7R8WHJ9_9CRUS|nr:unnamed protein product [Cyprideis torosa]CAG0899481.1 unnamed protein product [Cyprideis torosa]
MSLLRWLILCCMIKASLSIWAFVEVDYLNRTYPLSQGQVIIFSILLFHVVLLSVAGLLPIEITPSFGRALGNTAFNTSDIIRFYRFGQSNLVHPPNWDKSRENVFGVSSYGRRYNKFLPTLSESDSSSSSSVARSTTIGGGGGGRGAISASKSTNSMIFFFGGEGVSSSDSGDVTFALSNIIIAAAVGSLKIRIAHVTFSELIKAHL